MTIQRIVVCDNHPNVSATTRCLICGASLCRECAVVVDSYSACSRHAEDLRQLHSGGSATDLPRPDFLTRVLAYVTDGAILFGIGSFMLSIVMGVLRPAISFNDALVTHLLLFSAAFGIYATYFVSQNGRTPGHALYHLRVVDREGRTIGVRRAFLRWVGYFICTVPFLLGFLSVLGDPLGQGWHDKMADTIVIGPSLASVRKLRAAAALVAVLLLEVLYGLFTVSVR